MNGDKLSDIILGAPGARGGASYVIFGQAGGFSPEFNFSALNGVNGFAIQGLQSGDGLGRSVSSAGDMNGDGLDDIVLGAGGTGKPGASYIIFGQKEKFPSFFNLTLLDGRNGFNVVGLGASDNLGFSVSSAGDINGDRLDDIVLGARGANSYAGTCYVIFGQSSGFSAQFDLLKLNGTNGFSVPGLYRNDALGLSVGTAGDMNGDGIDDMVLSARAEGNLNTGISYVIFGQREPFSAQFDLSKLRGENGFAIPGLNQFYTGGIISANTAGDINGDKLADLIIGMKGINGSVRLTPGITYVILGQRLFPARLNLKELNGMNGFVVPPLRFYDSLGISANTAGDINGDGLADIVIGVLNTNLYSKTGSYVILGQCNGFPAQFNLSTLDGTNRLYPLCLEPTRTR